MHNILHYITIYTFTLTLSVQTVELTDLTYTALKTGKIHTKNIRLVELFIGDC